MEFFWEWWQVSGSFIFACFIKVIFRNLWNYSWKWILFFNFLLSLYKTSTDIPNFVSSESISITAANRDLSMEHKCSHENSLLLLYINFDKDYLLEKYNWMSLLACCMWENFFFCVWRVTDFVYGMFANDIPGDEQMFISLWLIISLFLTFNLLLLD